MTSKDSLKEAWNKKRVVNRNKLSLVIHDLKSVMLSECDPAIKSELAQMGITLCNYLVR
jgi:hypothetical protein